ncbi:MAG: hypothetical protein KJO35_08760, partial [Gammaproteobacteria bacterium]|nr:hypothetical protein [Gammaproteobacteria bacterium]
GDGDGAQTCDIGAFEAEPLFPDYYLRKSVATISDPYSGTTNPKAVPGAVVQYTVRIENDGPGAADQGTLVIIDAIPPETALVVTDFDGANPGPVAFVDGTPASGFTYTFVDLADAADDLEFSNDGGATFTYSPSEDANGSDAAVTHIRIQPAGTALYTGADPVAEFRFKVAVQ